jgi:hypothetical protein
VRDWYAEGRALAVTVAAQLDLGFGVLVFRVEAGQ